MFVPSENASSEKLLDYLGEYHLAAISAHPQMKDLSESFRAVQDALRTANEEERKADRAVTHAMARRDQADAALDAAVRRFFFELLGRNNNNRQAAEVRRLFPDGLDAITGAPVEQEMEKVKALEARIESEKQAGFAEFVKEIRQKRQEMEKAAADLRQAIAAHGTAFGLERAKRVDWIRQYTAGYGLLVGRLGRKADAERFFRRADRGESSEPAGSPEGTPP